MNCKKAEEYLVDYLYQELPAKKTLEIEKHLHGCTRCSSTLESWRAIHRAYQRTAEEPQVAPYTKQKILALAEEELSRSPSWKERFVWAVKIASVPIAIFVLVLFLNSKEKTDVAMQTEAPKPAAPISKLQDQDAAPSRPAEPSLAAARKRDLAENETKRREQESVYTDRLASAQEGNRADKEFAGEKKKTELSDVRDEAREAPAPAPAAEAPPPAVESDSGRQNYEEQIGRAAASQKAAGITSVSKNANEPFQKAQESLQNKDLKEGQNQLRQAISNDSHKVLAGKLHQEGNSYQNKGEYVNAILQFEQIPANYRDYAKMDDVLLSLGDSYAEVGQFDKAVKAYSQVSRGQQRLARERIERLRKKQEASKQLESLGYVSPDKE